MHRNLKRPPLMLLLMACLCGCGGGSLGTATASDSPPALAAPLAAGISSSAAPGTLALAAPSATAAARPELYFYLATNLKDDAQFALANQLIDRAKAAGYNGLVLSDYWANGTVYGPLFLTRLRQLLAHAASAGLVVIPQTFSFGYSDTIFAFGNPNLAEGQAVVGATFTVASDGNSLVLQPSTPGLADGGFETHNGDQFSLWNYQDPARVHADTSITHSGACSLRIDGGTSGNARIMKTVAVQPWHQYHLQVYLRTQGFACNPDQIDVRAFDAGTGNLRNFDDHRGPFKTQPSQDWTVYDLVFNSAASTSINLAAGIWGPSSGTVWFDDLSIQDSALVNVIRRKGAPLRVYDATTQYVEGSDFGSITDPLAFKNNVFDLYHKAPTVTVPAGSRLRPGMSVSMDYYAVAPVYNRPPGACLTDPDVTTYLNANMLQVNQNFPLAGGTLLNYDEMRHMNSCADCAARGLSAGELLAWHVAQSVAMVRSYRPNAPIYIWGDMFDPNQNALDLYYLVVGSLKGSWNGLPPGVVVMNWNLGNLATSLRFFSALGHDQIITGYFDSGDGTASANKELQASTGVTGVRGMMYTTWKNDYTQLESYAATALSGWNASLPH